MRDLILTMIGTNSNMGKLKKRCVFLCSDRTLELHVFVDVGIAEVKKKKAAFGAHVLC